jgi:hypothetical protein
MNPKNQCIFICVNPCVSVAFLKLFGINLAKKTNLYEAILYQTIMPLVANNQEFIELHKYYTTRTQNPLKKKQSLILLCCKLIRIYFAILTKGIKYDPQKMISDIRRPVLASVA